MKYNKEPNVKSIAFTLAEVLIVLGIIGVVAAMTIPTLVERVYEHSTVVNVKKMYSMLSQAYRLAVSDNGTPDEWGLTADGAGAEVMQNIFSKYLLVQKKCGATLPGCFPNVNYKELNGKDSGVNFGDTSRPSHAKIRLNNGASVVFYVDDVGCNSNSSYNYMVKDAPQVYKALCGNINVDINGDEKPNTRGIDIFNFLVTKYGIVPNGHPYLQSEGKSDLVRCNAKLETSHGDSCTAWVILKGNMDYLRGEVTW